MSKLRELCFRDCIKSFSFVHKKTFIKFCSTFLAKSLGVSLKNFSKKSSMCRKVSFFWKKTFFFYFPELRSERVGKEADIRILSFLYIHYNIKRKASEPKQMNWKSSKM